MTSEIVRRDIALLEGSTHLIARTRRLVCSKTEGFYGWRG
ncbi:Conserved hypothetical protein [Prochlorococcus marinus str. MIT 9313]|uniref:Uncharacterized protein n=1 Tax=Prochlorococcus marinus (strain MIT 9313) TaxID=74547 RepID=B9ESB2_PROMM|nr:Conserved hypothetical protein [Prochlorococcus marinus str. MIT 9313]